MKFLYTFRNRIEGIYRRHAGAAEYIVRLLLTFLTLLAIKENASYNTLLSQFWFIITFSVVCAFVRIRFLTVAIGVYAVVQYLSLSIGVGVLVAIFLLVVYLLYFRIEPKYGVVLILIPVLNLIKLVPLMPLILAVMTPASSVVAVICGETMYFLMHYIDLNSSVIQGFTDSGEMEKATAVMQGFITYKEFFYVTLIVIIIFFLTMNLKKLNMNYAGQLAMAAGAGLSVILQIVANMMFSTLTYAKLWNILICGVISFAISALVIYVTMPMDFARTELLEFEDDEYFYFLKAVPKVSLDKETVHVTRISSHRKAHSRVISRVKTETEDEEA